MYFGWYIVLVAALVFLALIGTTFSAFSLFVLPVSEDLRLSRAEVNTGLILLNLGNAVLSPFAGRLVDRYPARRLMVVGAVLYCFSLVTLSLSETLWISAIVLAVTLSLAVQLGGTLTLSVLVSRWFAIHRGRALALSVLGTSLASITTTPLIAWMIGSFEWRQTLLMVGIGGTLLLLGLALTIRERPGPNDIEPPAREPAAPVRAEPSPGTTLSMGEVLRQPCFWTIGIGVSLCLAAAQAITVSLIPLAVEKGLTLVQATGVLSAGGFAAIVGKLIISVFADRLDKAVVLALVALGTGALCLVMTTAHSFLPLLAVAAMLGIVTGGTLPVFYAILTDRFGVPSFGTVRGLTVPLTSLFGAAGLRVAGEIYDRTGGYGMLFVGLAVAQVFAALLLIVNRRNRMASLVGQPAG